MAPVWHRRLPLALRLALRELRGGLSGFRVFLACLAVGVASVAAVGSLSRALVSGLDADAHRLLGGDVELRLTHRTASDEEYARLRAAGRLSLVVEMRAMARNADKRTLVELKGVDDAYPLHGRMRLAPEGALAAALAKRDGLWGAVAESGLANRLGLALGDEVRIGRQTYRLAALVAHEPDRGADAFVLGPRLMVAGDSLAGTGLIREGSLIRYKYRLDLSAGTDIAGWTAEIEAAFPKAGWRVRDIRNGAPGIRRFVERMRSFLTLVGLSALLIGGLGIAGAVASHLGGRARTIAILKCLGAPDAVVFRIYLWQVAILALLGIAIGLVVGALAPMAVASAIAAYLPFEAKLGVYPRPLLIAAVYGLATALVFALRPLLATREVSAAVLIRNADAPRSGRPRLRDLALVGLAFATLAALAVGTQNEWRFALWFVLGAAAALAVFFLAAKGVVWLGRRLPRIRRPGLRLALANLHRPGAPTVNVVLSLGLGLTVMVTVGLLEGNLTRQVSERLPEEAPAFFFIDIQPDQIAPFLATARGVEGVGRVESVPAIRGRITKLAGRPVGEVAVAPSAEWVIHHDRGLTYAAEPPPEAEIIDGAWWPAGYAGPPLVSVSAEEAAGLSLAVGDTLTVNILGREVTAKVANLRRVNWATFSMNFVLVFAPGLLERAPHSFIATAEAPRSAEAALEGAVIDAFPNISAIRVREALEAVRKILDNIAVAVGATATVTLLAGVLVLAGALAAGHRRRVYDAVVLKVLGARRREIVAAYLMEYLILGVIAALIAAVVGAAAAWLIVTEIMRAGWIWLPGTLFSTLAIAVTVPLALGLWGTWRALSVKPAPLLRNE